MFEKEAEEYRTHFENELYLFDNTDIFPNNIEEAFQDGAKFGYNKGFEFGVKSNKKVNQIVANEWHYVKNGELPLRDDYYVIACHSVTGNFTDRCQWLNNEWWVADGEVKHFINEKVYAWKEKSEPPKEIE